MAFRANLGDDAFERLVRQTDVDEARSCDLGRRDEGILREVIDDGLGDVARLHMSRLGRP